MPGTTVVPDAETFSDAVVAVVSVLLLLQLAMAITIMQTNAVIMIFDHFFIIKNPPF
jgi:sterol desaturase/sphingolipid hydroxylase (fatty acid hydroxylase superfamily)